MTVKTVPISPLGDAAPAVVRIFGARPFHTDGDLLALAFGPDGDLWSIEEPGVLRHWNVGMQRQLNWFSLDELATFWAFSPDARFVVAASDDVTVWDVATGEVQTTWEHPSWVTALAFRGENRMVAVGDDNGSIRLWDWSTAAEVAFLEKAHKRAVSALAFSPDGSLLASAGEDKLIHLWDVTTGTPLRTLKGHTDRIPSLAWHPDGRRLVSAGWDTTARVWDATTGEPIILLNSHAMQVHALTFSPAGSRLACADSSNAVHVWDFEKNRTVTVLRQQAGEVRCLAFSPDGTRLAFGGVERSIRIWDAAQVPENETPIDPQLCRTCIAVTAGGSRLASLGAGTSVRVFDLATAEPAIELYEADSLRSFAASPDGRWFAASLASPEEAKPSKKPPLAKMALWDASSGKVHGWLEGQPGPVTSLAFAPDSTTLATAGYQASDVWLWNIPSGEPKLLIPAAVETCSVEALAFHPNGQTLAVAGIDYMATGGSDGRIVLWDLAMKRPARTFEAGATAIAFAPDGKHFAAAMLTRSVCIWDVTTGALVAEFERHIEPITSLVYSPDGSLLAVGCDDRSVRLWDPATGKPRGAIEIDTQVKALAFAPDGRSLFTGNANTSCYQLDVTRLLAAKG